MRFYVDIGVNLGLQFIIGLLITCWACEFRWIILPKWIPLKKKKKKKKKSSQMVRSYTILHTILPFLWFCYDFKLFGETFWWGRIVKSCDFTIRITILTTMIELLGNTKKSLMKRGEKKKKYYMQNILSQELTNIFCI